MYYFVSIERYFSMYLMYVDIVVSIKKCFAWQHLMFQSNGSLHSIDDEYVILCIIITVACKLNDSKNWAEIKGFFYWAILWIHYTSESMKF